MTLLPFLTAATTSFGCELALSHWSACFAIMNASLPNVAGFGLISTSSRPAQSPSNLSWNALVKVSQCPVFSVSTTQRSTASTSRTLASIGSSPIQSPRACPNGNGPLQVAAACVERRFRLRRSEGVTSG